MKKFLAGLWKRRMYELVRHFSEFRSTERTLVSAEIRNERLELENRELSERVNAIGERLFSVSVQCSPEFGIRRLRVCVEIDARIIEQGFLHGNDATIIDYLGRNIGARAANEIRRANFQRWEM
jgi:hypothetical protein